MTRLSRAPFALVLGALLVGCSMSAASGDGTQNASALRPIDGDGDDATTNDEVDHDGLLWVNKERCLPCGFVPGSLVGIEATAHASASSPVQVRDFVRAPLQKMLADARAATGLTVVVASAYRSFYLQVSILNGESNNAGIGPCQAAREVAPPGRSEHQLGTAVDLGAVDAHGGGYYLDAFATTAAGTWVRDHAHEYGFVMSYPDARREAITGYRHEPWHFRYLGVTAAARAFAGDWSVQEYFVNAAPPTSREAMTCGACQASRGAMSGCPTNTFDVFTCGHGPASGSRVRCELGLITCDACAGGLCQTKPTPQDDVCANGSAGGR